MRGPQRVLVSGEVELAGGVLTQRLQHPVPGVGGDTLRDYQ
jgi:hypothetical protein